ncbi:hypothetical protein KY284_010933 [Solanum tuberosum]|nr:hypothetical protein KY284_010933 [Solanum tuberosum]
MEDQIFRTIDGSIKVVKDSWSKNIVEIQCMLQAVVGKLSPTTPRFSLDSCSSMEVDSVKIPRFNGNDPATWVFQSQEAPDRRLAFFRQLTTIDYCPEGTTTIPSWNTKANSPSPQYWNVGYDYNNQTFAHKVFGGKTDKKTENVVNVKAMLQTPDSMKPKGEYKDIPVQVKTAGAEILLTNAKQENYDSKEISNSDLDDNKEDPLPLVMIMTYIQMSKEACHCRSQKQVLKLQ